MTLRYAVLAIAMFLSALPTLAQPTLTRESLGPGLTGAVFLTHAPGDSTRLFILDRNGRILVKHPGLDPTVFLDILDLVQPGGEQGLLGLAFHPRYAETGYFYVKYNKQGSPNSNANHVARFQVTAAPDVADPLSHTVILRTSNSGGNHNAGWIGFGPDGYLYITQGNNAGNSQDPTNFGGKVLRLDIDGDDFPDDPDRNYAIPAGNPYVGIDGNDEIFAIGLRNPWRASFDRETGDLWIGDVGDSGHEELSIIPAGQPGLNFGYPCLHGFDCNGSNCDCDSPIYTPPVYDYPRSLGGCVVGGYVYRGCAIPDLRGAYIFADYLNSRVWSLRRTTAGITDFRDLTAQLGISGLASLGEDAAGELYICTLTNGVHKIIPVIPAAACPAPADLDCDGAITFYDIDPFLLALILPDDYHQAHPTCFRRLADLNADGRIDFFDIDPFVACIVESVCP